MYNTQLKLAYQVSSQTIKTLKNSSLKHAPLTYVSSFSTAQKFISLQFVYKKGKVKMLDMFRIII